MMKEKVFIEFKDLFSSLLITLRNNGIKPNKISYSLIDEYGCILLENLKKNNIDVIFKLDNKNIDDFLLENSNYYIESEIDGSIIILKNIPLEQIILNNQFILSTSLLDSIYDNRVVKLTLEAYKNEFIESNKKALVKWRINKVFLFIY